MIITDAIGWLQHSMHLEYVGDPSHGATMMIQAALHGMRPAGC
jgi:hypothetical protein